MLYRKDANQLVIMKAGLRNHNFLVLDDIIYLPQYKSFDVECARDGLFLSNPDTNYIYVLDSDLQVKYSLQLAFD